MINSAHEELRLREALGAFVLRTVGGTAPRDPVMADQSRAAEVIAEIQRLPVLGDKRISLNHSSSGTQVFVVGISDPTQTETQHIVL